MTLYFNYSLALERRQVDEIRQSSKSMEEFYLRVGRFYGYPDCCIWFFIRAWPGICEQNSGDIWWVYATLGHSLGFEQIPCPACMRQRLFERDKQEGKDE